MSALSAEECLAALSGLTHMTVQEWRDFLSLTPEQQTLVVQGYRGQSWTTAPSVFDEVLRVLGVLGAIAGVVGGVAGAVSAVAALRSL